MLLNITYTPPEPQGPVALTFNEIRPGDTFRFLNRTLVNVITADMPIDCADVRIKLTDHSWFQVSMGCYGHCEMKSQHFPSSEVQLLDSELVVSGVVG